MPVLLGIIAGLLIFNATITPDDLAREVEKGLRQRIGEVSELHVSLKGPKGYKLCKGNLRRAEVFIRGFDADKLNLRELTPPPTPTTIGEGKADSVTVRVSRIGELIIHCHEFQYENTPVRELHIYLSRVQYDREAAKKNKFQLLGIEKGIAEVSLSQAAVEKRVIQMLPELEEVRVALDVDRITVAGKKRVLLVPVPFEVEGALRPRGNEVHFVNPRLKVAGVGLPSGFTTWLLKEINPVYVFDEKGELPFAVNIKAISSNSDGILARAHLSLRR